ncbi:hemogen isoform X1 [Manis pentadactyla]|uniref:hemogen isoform X1 n=1 Tax=Manis pentadactyla TaxID=143292 RepID=UPI00255CFE9A|nr:hemogen isoform X1 [Manis pentadactyla]XP_036744204.2 hemogen isoform X1 [Manis pentadactyla]XP_057354858.1 hemogen isoform X1 [Manis pentadactyla]KAI5158288.1 Hemogen [Manis pentadactyla]
MDLGKDHCHLTHHQKPDRLQEKNHVPEVIGTWSLRNREQLRKRKAEAQERQTSQWQFGEKKCRRQRTGKGNERGRKRQQNTELKVEPQSQLENEMMEEVLAPPEKEIEPLRGVTEALPSVASPQEVMPEIFAISQESIIQQENSSEYQETAVQNHPSEPEDFSPKMCQERAVAKALPSKTSEDIADLEGCCLEACPKPDVPNRYTLETYQKNAEPKEYSSEPGQEIAETESAFPKIQQEIAVPKDLSTKTYQETVEHFSQTSTTEIAVTRAPFHQTIQETPVPEEYPPEICQEPPEPEDCSPEIYQETPGPEDLSTKTYKSKDVSKECFPEPYQETGGPQDQHPKAQLKDSEDVYTFPQEMQEKPKAEGPEIPAISNVPQEIHSENDIYSYVLL